jgi:hypothetical protein
MASLRIIALCVLSAVVYGIIHDQVTARICVEYFTIGHPPVFGTEDPTLLGLGWGVIATWWVGAILGVPLAIACQAGPRPQRTARTLVRPLAILLATTGLCAMIAGLIGWTLAGSGAVFLIGPVAEAVPQERHIPFLTDLWMHSASYLIGAVGGIVLIVQAWRSRRYGLPEGNPRYDRPTLG